MGAPHAFASYSIQDAKGKIAVTKINFPVNVDIGVLRTNFIPTTATLLNAIILGKIINASIGIEVDLSSATIRTLPDLNSDVEEGVYVPMQAATGAKAGFRIPTIDEAVMEAGGSFADLTNTDVTDFLLRIASGQTVVATNVSPSDDRGSDIVAVGQPYDQFKSSRGKPTA